MNWAKITDNQKVVSLLKKRQRIEEEIKAIDEKRFYMTERKTHSSL